MKDVQYFNNADLASDLSVSTMTISRYIEAAKHGNNNIELIKMGPNYKIKRSEYNLLELKSIVGDKKNFKNPTRFKLIEPNNQFYEKYDKENVLEIIRNLKNEKFINTKFTYLGDESNKYLEYQKSRKNNHVRSNLMMSNLLFFRDLAKTKGIKFNITELGPLDMTSSYEFINELNKEGLVNSYHGIDISKTLLEMNEKFFKSNFKDLDYTSEIIDIEESDIFQTLMDNKYRYEEPDKIINLFIFIGCTSSNLLKPELVYRNISESLKSGDYFVLDLVKDYPDIEKNKIYTSESLMHNYLVQVLDDIGFKNNYFTLNSFFEKESKLRRIFATLNENVLIKFRQVSEMIELKKGTEILLLINRIDLENELFLTKKVKFDLISMNTSITMDYINTVFIKN
jgi:hypothetical protein